MNNEMAKQCQKNRASTPVDDYIGLRIRRRRTSLDLTQVHIANALGISAPQLQKYENGQNRLSASRLLEMSKVLKVPIDYFFEGLPYGASSSPEGASPAQTYGISNENEQIDVPSGGKYDKCESPEPMRAYIQTPDGTIIVAM